MLEVWKAVQEEFTCEHECSRLVRFTKSNGTTCIREQCSQCGANVRDIPKKGYDIDALPAWNHALREDWFQAQQKRRNELIEQQQAEDEQERENRNAEWWRQYNQYLRSQHWHDMRKKVIERDGEVCQACLRNKATQVHHLSYALYQQLGRSAAFELVAICYSCHCAIHPQLAESQRKLSFYNPYLNGGNNGHK